MNLISTLLILSKAQKEVKDTQIQSCNEVNELFLKLLSDESSSLKQLYTLLQTVLRILSRKRGPKSFKKLLDQIFNFIKNYSYDRIKSYQQQIVILNLTYYEKIIYDCLSNLQKLQIAIIYAVANLHAYLRNFDKRRLNSLQEKVQQATKIQTYQVYYMNILSLLYGILKYLKGEYKKSKTIFANLLTKIMTEQKSTINSYKNLQIMTVCCYYSYYNLYQLGQIQLSYYYLTKSHQFGRKIGPKAHSFIERIKEIGEHTCFRVVRLTRIENKLQILNRRTKSTWNTKTKIYNQKKQCDKNIIKEQLRNIFTIKDTKATMYKFRKDNLKYLKGQQNKLTHSIQNKKVQIQNIQQRRQQLQKLDQINKIQKRVQQLENDRSWVRYQFQQLKFKHLDNLKQVKIINRYLWSYINVIKYEKDLYVYSFLYKQNKSRKKLIVLSEINKRRMAKIKINIKLQKVFYKGLKYLCEVFQILSNQNTQLLLYKKKDPGYYLRVYPIQKKAGIASNQGQIQLKKQTFQKLKETPFYYMFQCIGNKIISWEQYFNHKSLMTIYFIRKFILKLTKKCIQKEPNQQIFRKISVNLKIQCQTIISTLLFVWIKKKKEKQQYSAQKQKYEALIFTVGGQKYVNKIYNINLQKKIQIQTNNFSDQQANTLVKGQLIKNFQQKVKQINKINKFIKYVYCKRYLNKLKQRNKIFVIVQGRDIITYCKYQSGKCFIIAENIDTKDRQMVETIMEYHLFNKVNSIKDRLVKHKNCRDKLKIICKFIWTKYFIQQLKTNYKRASILTDFQVSFRNRIIFSKIFTNFIYKKKLIKQKVFISLIVESLLQFPRPYILRVFTINNNNPCLDVKYRIYNREKVFYQKNTNNLNKIMNFISKYEFQIIDQNEISELFHEKFLVGYPRKRCSFLSRGSRTSFGSIICSNKSFGQQSEIISSRPIIPKIKSKKDSLLIRINNRKSNQINIDINKLINQKKNSIQINQQKSNSNI